MKQRGLGDGVKTSVSVLVSARVLVDGLPAMLRLVLVSMMSALMARDGANVRVLFSVAGVDADSNAGCRCRYLQESQQRDS